MAKKKVTPPKNLSPRREVAPTELQFRFAVEYVSRGFSDRVGAVMAAGYQPKDRDNAHSLASDLLRKPAVKKVILEAKAKLMARCIGDAADAVMYLKYAAVEALNRGQLAVAVAALSQLGKHFGIYEAHNKQRAISEEEAQRLRRLLEQNGMDFTRVNFPKPVVLQQVPDPDTETST